MLVSEPRPNTNKWRPAWPDCQAAPKEMLFRPVRQCKGHRRAALKRYQGLKESHLLKEDLGRAHRIGRVDDDGVISSLCRVRHPFDAVCDAQAQPRVFEALRQLRRRGCKLSAAGLHAISC